PRRPGLHALRHALVPVLFPPDPRAQGEPDVRREEPVRMKALQKPAPAPGAVFGPADDLRIKPDEILVKVHRASICGSDLPIYNWNSWAPDRFKTPST